MKQSQLSALRIGADFDFVPNKSEFWLLYKLSFVLWNVCLDGELKALAVMALEHEVNEILRSLPNRGVQAVRNKPAQKRDRIQKCTFAACIRTDEHVE